MFYLYWFGVLPVLSSCIWWLLNYIKKINLIWRRVFTDYANSCRFNGMYMDYLGKHMDTSEDFLSEHFHYKVGVFQTQWRSVKRFNIQYLILQSTSHWLYNSTDTCFVAWLIRMNFDIYLTKLSGRLQVQLSIHPPFNQKSQACSELFSPEWINRCIYNSNESFIVEIMSNNKICIENFSFNLCCLSDRKSLLRVYVVSNRWYAHIVDMQI